MSLEDKIDDMSNAMHQEIEEQAEFRGETRAELKHNKEDIRIMKEDIKRIDSKTKIAQWAQDHPIAFSVAMVGLAAGSTFSIAGVII